MNGNRWPHILFWSQLIPGQLIPDCFPKYWLPKVTLSWNLLAELSCEHWVTTRDDMTTPCSLLSVVAGWVTITMEVIISHWKWEHPHWTVYREKTPRFPKCHEETPFPRYSFKPQWNPVRSARFASTQWKQWIQSIPFKRPNCFVVANSNSFSSSRVMIPSYMASQGMIQRRAVASSSMYYLLLKEHLVF